MYKNAVCFGTVRCFRHLSYLVVGLPDFGTFGLRFPFRNSSLSPLFRFLLFFASFSPSLPSLLLLPHLSLLSFALPLLALPSRLTFSPLLFSPSPCLSHSAHFYARVSIAPPTFQGFRVLRYESISVPIFSSLLRSSLSTSLLCRMATFAIANFRAAIAR